MIDKYTQKFDNILMPSFCENLINKYEIVTEKERSKIDSLSICNKNGKMTCDNCDCLRVNLMQHDIFKEDIQTVIRGVQKALELYKIETEVDYSQLPSKFGYESLKIKRYNPDNKQGMNNHIDVFDIATSKRFLAFIFYLNDSFDGGETVFVDGKTIKPQTGSVVVFPPYWPWLHKAETIKSGTPKYFLGTYLHYPN